MSNNWDKILMGNGTQLKQSENLWEPASHNLKYETHIMGPVSKPFFWPLQKQTKNKGNNSAVCTCSLNTARAKQYYSPRSTMDCMG